MQEIPTVYKAELFVHPESVANYKCPICFNVQKDPLLCKEGHGYCRSCILKRKEQSATCPTCNEVLDILVPNRDAGRTIAESLVYCYTRLPGILVQGADGTGDSAVEDVNEASSSSSNNSSSSIARRTRNHQGTSATVKRARIDQCKWTGKLQDAASHFLDCVYAGVACSYEGCSAVVPRKDLNEHEAGCDHRSVLCKWFGCNEVISGAAIAEHQSQCPMRLITCPNAGCGTKVAFAALAVHRDNSCQYGEVPCPFTTYGCTAHVLRKDVDSHGDTAAREHIRLLVKRLGDQQRLVDQQQKDISQQQRAIDQQQQLINRQQQLIKSLEDNMMPDSEVIVFQVKYNELTGKVPCVPRFSDYPSRLYSKEKVVRGYKVRLFVETNDSDPEDRNYFGVYLSIIGGPFPCKVQCTFEQVHCDGLPASAFKRAAESIYENPADCWGYGNFISKADLASADNNPYVKDGYVTFKCTFKFI